MDDLTLPNPPATSADATPLTCLTYEELSRRTGLSISTLRRRVKDGTIPFLQPGSRRSRIVFPIDIVERLLACVPAPAPSAPRPKQNARGPRPKWKRRTHP